MKRSSFIFGTLLLLTAVAFVTDLIWGSLDISPADVLQALTNGSEKQTTNDYVIRNFRLPKALTALFAGAGISIAGLQMQSLFRNPLADTSILGINSGAGLGVALYIMSFTIIPGLSLYSGTADTWGVATAACIGSMLVLLLISAVAAWLRDMVSVLIVGVMVGFLASSFISILQFFSDNEMLKGYLIWSFGSVAGTTWRQLSLMIPIVSGGLFLSMLMPKYMNALNIGENYARSVGIHVERERIILIGITSIITGTITAFTGPIAFLGIAVPHFSRILLKSSDYRILLPGTMLCGALLMLVCDMITQVPGKGFVLPINAITSMIGAPVVIMTIARNRKKRLIFN